MGTRTVIVVWVTLLLAVVGCDEPALPPQERSHPVQDGFGDSGGFGGGGACHNRETGEVLTEVRDSAGDLYRVEKMETFCGIPVQAQVGNEPVGGMFAWSTYPAVYHPDSGAPIKVGEQTFGGWRALVASTWEWY